MSGTLAWRAFLTQEARRHPENDRRSLGAVPQIPDVPEDEETADDIVVTGPEGDRFTIELPDLGEPTEHRPRKRLPGDGLLGR